MAIHRPAYIVYRLTQVQNISYAYNNSEREPARMIINSDKSLTDSRGRANVVGLDGMKSLRAHIDSDRFAAAEDCRWTAGMGFLLRERQLVSDGFRALCE